MAKSSEPARPVARLAPLAGCGAVVGAGAVLASVDPADTRLFPPCPFLAVTGYWCPGCGSLRGLHHLLTGDPAAALALNPLMVAALVLLVAAVVVWVGRRTGLLGDRPLVLPTPLPWAVLVTVVAFGVLRNVPAAPFSALAP